MADGEGALAALREFVRGMNSAGTVVEASRIVTRTARALTGADGVTVVLGEGDFCYYVEEDAISELWKGRRFPAGTCISGWCIRTGLPAVIGDVFADPRIPHDVYRKTFVRSMVMVPVGEGKAIAAVGAYWSVRQDIGEKDVEQLVAVSSILKPHLARLGH